LGYRPRPFEETVHDTLAWFAEAEILVSAIVFLSLNGTELEAGEIQLDSW